MKKYSHPAMEEITLATVMQALADPCRMAIVRGLLGAEDRAMACNEVPLEVSKATRSHHFKILREAGIILNTVEGTKAMTVIRKAELDERFPGLLALVAAQKGAECPEGGKSSECPEEL